MEIRRIKLKMIFWGDGSTGRESEDTHQRDGILTQTRAATFQTCMVACCLHENTFHPVSKAEPRHAARKLISTGGIHPDLMATR